MVERALALGAKPIAPQRAKVFVEKLRECFRGRLTVLTAAGLMGEDYLQFYGKGKPECEVVHVPSRDTTAEDTIKTVRSFVERGVDLVVFVGGDGTAKDVLSALGEVCAALGVPAGVKMHSGCFAATPAIAAHVVAEYLTYGLPVREVEVLDVDEESYRANHFQIRLHGYMRVPVESSLVCGSKGVTVVEDEEENLRAVAKYFVEELYKPGAIYVLGPGNTVTLVARELGVEKTLLGTDLLKDGKIIVKDASEKEILEHLQKGCEVKIVVSPIGKQGILFGRGNKQISHEVIRRVGKENVIVLATRRKMEELRNTGLWVDTDDESVNSALRGYIRAVVDYREVLAVKVR